MYVLSILSGCDTYIGTLFFNYIYDNLTHYSSVIIQILHGLGEISQIISPKEVILPKGDSPREISPPRVRSFVIFHSNHAIYVLLYRTKDAQKQLTRRHLVNAR